MTDAESGLPGAQASAAGIFAAELKAQRGGSAGPRSSSANESATPARSSPTWSAGHGGPAWTSRSGVTTRWACRERWNGCMS